jgi:hypothetical protein
MYTGQIMEAVHERAGERIVGGQESVRDTLFSAVLSAGANTVAGERRVATDQRELG